MKVKLAQLEVGCILAADVTLITSQPIMKKDTVLTQDLLNVLSIFLVDIVEVEPKLITGERFNPKEVIEEPISKVEEEKEFITLYLEAVQEYKRLFLGWQAGIPVDVGVVRKQFLPLFEEGLKNASDILKLHHYSIKEEYIYHHSVCVGILSAYMAKNMNLSRAEWVQVGLAGLLSDVGMAKISSKILNKKGSLTTSEFEEVKKHPIYSYRMLKGLTGITDAVLLAILQHHEREDGTGYPMASNAKKIHAFSQIVAVADVFHAMTSERYYRSKQSPFKVIEALAKEQFGKFQPSVVQTLTHQLMSFSIGTFVRLNNGELGEIIFINQQEPTRPMIKLKASDEIINLFGKSELYIEDIMS